MVYPY